MRNNQVTAKKPVEQSDQWNEDDSTVELREWYWVKWQPEQCWYPVVSIGYRHEIDGRWMDLYNMEPFAGKFIGWKKIDPPAL